MENNKLDPFKFRVSIIEILNFDIDRPETYTSSSLVNAVLRAIAIVGPHSAKAISDYLGVPGKQLWPAIELATGYQQLELRMVIVNNLLQKLSKQHPDWSTDMLAKALGYNSRSDLKRILGDDYDSVSNKSKEKRYAKNRSHKPKE